MALKTVDNPGIAKQTHIVNIPPLCPKTNNPIDGSTLTIIYRPKDKLLEVYSLGEYVASFVGSPDVRDIELLTQVVGGHCADALGAKVEVVGKFVLNIGQTVICEYQS